MRPLLLAFASLAFCAGTTMAYANSIVVLVTEPGGGGGGGGGGGTGSGTGTGTGSGSVFGSGGSTVSPSAAPGDAVNFFNLSATLTDGSSIEGILPFDFGQPYEFVQGAQVFESIDLGGVTHTQTFGATESESCINLGCELTLGSTVGPNTLELVFTGDPYSGLTLQTVALRNGALPVSNLDYDGQGTINFQSGSLTGSVKSFDISPVPEPSSIALLGTGLLGVAGVVRRRRISKS